MKKGDKQFDVGYGQGGGGGMAGAYRGPSGNVTGGGGTYRDGFTSGVAYGKGQSRPYEMTRQAGFKDGMEYGRNMEKAYQAQANQKIEIPKSAIRNDRIDKPMGAAAIGMGAAAGAGVLAKKRKDAEKMEEYKRKPRMADGPPKINPRKAYEE